MQLTKNDKQILLEWGYNKKDLDQIEIATSLTKYEYKNKLICDEKARKLLGDDEYLSGIARSAFHWSACRQTPCDETIMFDSSALFE